MLLGCFLKDGDLAHFLPPAFRRLGSSCAGRSDRSFHSHDETQRLRKEVCSALNGPAQHLTRDSRYEIYPPVLQGISFAVECSTAEFFVHQRVRQMLLRCEI